MLQRYRKYYSVLSKECSLSIRGNRARLLVLMIIGIEHVKSTISNHYCLVNFFKIVISYVFSICCEKNDCFRLEIIIMLWSDLFKFIERAGQCSKID